MKRDKQAHVASSVTSQQQNHMLKPATCKKETTFWEVCYKSNLL